MSTAPSDGINSDRKDRKETPLSVARATLCTLVIGYYFWFILYVLLGIASIALPGVAAAVLQDPNDVKTYAGLGAIAAAVFAFLRPHDQASAYDAAAIIAWKTKVQARLGLLTQEDTASQLQKAIEKAGLKYGNLPHGSPG
jgi:hypothetical protein